MLEKDLERKAAVRALLAATWLTVGRRLQVLASLQVLFVKKTFDSKQHSFSFETFKMMWDIEFWISHPLSCFHSFCEPALSLSLSLFLSTFDDAPSISCTCLRCSAIVRFRNFMRPTAFYRRYNFCVVACFETCACVLVNY